MKSPPTIVVQIVHIQGPYKGDIQEFLQDVIVIGRHPSCHLRFPADLTVVSRKHAEIARDGNRFKIVDNNSTNGTYVNGKRISETYLKDGDVIAFSEAGPKVSFLSQVQETAAGFRGSSPAVTPDRASRESTPPPREPVQIPRESVQAPREPVQPFVASHAEQKTDEVPVGPVRVPLLVQYGPTLRSFKELPIIIGKSSKCDLAIPHPALQDRHVQIFFWQDRYWVKDLTGQMLIRVNHIPIGVQAPLNTDDELALSPQGPTFRFLGEGRLAEIESSSSEPEAPAPERDRQAPEHPASGEPDSKKSSSLFKKFFS